MMEKVVEKLVPTNASELPGSAMPVLERVAMIDVMGTTATAIMGPPSISETCRQRKNYDKISNNKTTNSNIADQDTCGTTDLFKRPKVPMEPSTTQDKNAAATTVIMGPPPPPATKTQRQNPAKKSDKTMKSLQQRKEMHRKTIYRNRRFLRIQYLKNLVEQYEEAVGVLRGKLEKYVKIGIQIDDTDRISDRLTRVIDNCELKISMKQTSDGEPSQK